MKTAVTILLTALAIGFAWLTYYLGPAIWVLTGGGHG